VPLDVKAAVADALLELIRRKDADKITVKDLVEVCGISRQTFYYHFKDIVDVVEWAAQQGVQRLVRESLNAATPQEAFYAEKESLPLKESAGRVCSEFVMCYPPGIPILAPGERITPGILEYINYAKEKGCSLTGPEDLEINRLNVLKNPR
jgi:arginine/lysine/ornithine decarboxylase